MLAVGANTSIPVNRIYFQKIVSPWSLTNSFFPPLSHLGYLTRQRWQHHKDWFIRAILLS